MSLNFLLFVLLEMLCLWLSLPHFLHVSAQMSLSQRVLYLICFILWSLVLSNKRILGFPTSWGPCGWIEHATILDNELQAEMRCVTFPSSNPSRILFSLKHNDKQHSRWCLFLHPGSMSNFS